MRIIALLRKNFPERRNQRRQEALARGWTGAKRESPEAAASYVAEVVQNTAGKLS